MNFKKIIQIPASTTNLGAGFDTLGLALRLFLKVEIEASNHGGQELLLKGEGASELPRDHNNLIWRVARRVFDGEGRAVPCLQLAILNQVPLARGLGSSAAAIVAGISCFEACTGIELSQEKFFSYGFEFESHPDNLTAARYGGFTVSCVGEPGRVTFSRSTVSPQLKILVTVPEFQLQTEKARAALPGTLSLRDAIFNIQRSSLTVAALLNSQFHLLHESMRDKVHQPYRAPLIPGFEEILSLNQTNIVGLLGVCLSGAGPSVLAFASENLSEIYQRIAGIFAKYGIQSRALELEVDNDGRTIQEVIVR